MPKINHHEKPNFKRAVRSGYYGGRRWWVREILSKEFFFRAAMHAGKFGMGENFGPARL